MLEHMTQKNGQYFPDWLKLVGVVGKLGAQKEESEGSPVEFYRAMDKRNK